MGNRLSSLGVSSYTNNSSNELTATSNATYGYDLNGNAITRNDSTGITTYAWDFENRLTSVALPGTGGTVSFKYDPFGRRIYKSSSPGTSIFAYDGANLIEETNSSGAAVARYSQGENIDEPLAILRGGVTSFYHADAVGSVTSLSNAAGSLAQTYTYDSFGKQTATSGSLTNPFQYTAREFDPESSLYFYRARYYDAAPGRFVSEDPLAFSIGVNFYVYVSNNSVKDVDPAGLEPYDLWKRTRRRLKIGSCFLSFYSCGFHLGEDRKAIDSMSVDDIVNTAIAQGNKGDLGMQRVGQCLSADQNCQDLLNRCIKLALTNPFPPPWWLSDLINYFSKNPVVEAPKIKHE